MTVYFHSDASFQFSCKEVTILIYYYVKHSVTFPILSSRLLFTRKKRLLIERPCCLKLFPL